MITKVQEIKTEDLYWVEGLKFYRLIFNDESIKNEADRIFEETQDLKAVEEFCRESYEKKHINPLMLDSEINKRFQNCRFSNFEIETEVFKKAKNDAEKYANTIISGTNNGSNLVIVGNGDVGTGKTHLACAIANRLFSENIPAKFINITSMLSELRENFNASKYIKVPVLIIDDIGKEKGTEWVLEQIYCIVNQRYEDVKPTIFTTEGNLKDLADKYSTRGKAIISRITSDFTQIKCTGRDYRQKRKTKIYGGHYD